MNKKRKIPVPEPDKQELEYVCPSASWGDMTGLIPANPNGDEQLFAYDKLYPYLPEYNYDKL